MIALTTIYLDRNYTISEIGRNIALFNIWYMDLYGWKEDLFLQYQDKHCPNYIENWNEYKAARDQYSQLFNLLS